MAMDKVTIPAEVMERVNSELVRAVLETPDYIKAIVTELLAEPGKYNSYDHSDDYKRNLFERVLRKELRGMVERSLVECLREKYGATVKDVIDEAVNKQEALTGSLAEAFGVMLKDDWKLNATVNFELKKVGE